MGRKDTLAAKSIRKMYEQLNLNQSDIFSKTKLLLSVYRDVVWITLSESARVNEELVYYGEELDSALVYLELFAPDTEKQEFESRISALFENKWMVDLIDTAMAKIYDYPIFAVLIGTGLRVGELTGLRWCDVDLENGVIDVNHTLVYYDHRTDGSKKGCYFNVNTPKTPAGKRKVPMLSFVKEAIIMEKERQELLDLHCIATIDGYTDFIFINRFGNPQHQGTLNKAIRRIIRDCNDEQFLKNENPEVLLPHFSCHSLRHTFTTRMCEAGVNVKVIQDTLGHKDISTTLNIYTDVTKELRQSEFEGLDSYFKSEYNKVSNE